jgi:hypothetical protein
MPSFPSHLRNEIQVPYRPADAVQSAASRFRSAVILPTSLSTIPRHIRTRRKRYLELNPTYFDSASTDLEISGMKSSSHCHLMILSSGYFRKLGICIRYYFISTKYPVIRQSSSLCQRYPKISIYAYF